jgi:hypothetical protein
MRPPFTAVIYAGRKMYKDMTLIRSGLRFDDLFSTVLIFQCQ